MNQREVPLTVNPGDILPIIKRFLYSEREIFLRELLSNSLDALEKVDKVVRYDPDFSADNAELRVTVTLDSFNNTLTITDNGVGMTEDQVIRYINQIAVSGAREFLEQHKDGAHRLIGKFGLGFYSSFMVSKLVEIHTWSWKPGAGGCHWSCAGGTITRIGPTARRERGTSVICHLDADAREFLGPQRLEAIVRRFLDFSPFPIFHDGRQLNLVTAPWHLNRAERDQIGREKYHQLYERMSPGENQPIGWFHAETDGQFEARALVFLPDRRSGQLGKLRVYANRTFICDHCPELLPAWLGFLDGVVDASDLPLNVARDHLREDRQIAILRQFLTKKTLDFLADLLARRRADYNTFWERCGTFLKRGYVESLSAKDNTLSEKLEKLLLFPSSRQPLSTLEEYFGRTPAVEKHCLLYLTDERAQSAHIELLRNRNREVLWFTEPTDVLIAEVVKRMHPDWSLQRVDEERGADAGNMTEVGSIRAEPSGEWDALTEIFREIVGSAVTRISVASLPSKEIPAVLRVDRDGVIQDVLRQFTGKESVGESHRVLLLNTNCPLIRSLGRLGSQLRETDLPTALVSQIWDNIRLNCGLMSQDQVGEASRRHADFLALVASKLADSKLSTPTP